MEPNKNVVEFLCKLEGYKTAVKNFHFSASCMSEHKLFDEIADIIAENQDEIGEIEQGVHGQFGKDVIKATPYTMKTSRKFLKDVLKETSEFYKSIQTQEYVGMRSVVENFMGELNKYTYLLDLCVKEDFKRDYKRRINESRNSGQMVRMTASEFNKVLHEAVSNVVGRLLRENEEAEAEVKGGNYSDKELDYTHFAVNKQTNLVVDGWGYAGYDSEELRQNRKDYFDEDLRSNGFNPKMYKILSFKACQKNGIDPNNKQTWSNTGVFPLAQEVQMKKEGQNPFELAKQEHPDWFVEN